MATTDVAIGVDSTREPAVYDGFISYSHAADDLLAPRLQAGLQRFAKPWWKRRALRMFRDETSLSANPHLWSSITDALDDSEWFVLLLSEDAARSEWVDREVAYWLEHKGPSRIIPVVTDGEVGWADGDISPQSTVAPPSLFGMFADEPRWVDLRFARTDEHVDLRHTQFRDAVADIASAIRGIPKDQLESEEIIQHRRTIRTAWAAGIVVLLLGVAATVGAIVAFDQSNEARAQRDEAQRNATLARSRELAASAINVLGEDAELSVLLALLSADQADPTFESVSALHEALQAHRTVRTIEWPVEPVKWPMFPGMAGSISPDGQHVAVSGAQHQLAVWDLKEDSVEPSWTFEVPPSGYANILAYFTSDGSHVVATVAWFNAREGPELWPEPAPEAGVYVLDADTGEEIHHFRGPRCPIVALFQSGVFLDETRLVGAAAPSAEDCSLGGGADIWLMDLRSGEVTPGYGEPVFSWHWGTPASLSSDGRLMSLVDDNETTSKVVDLRNGKEIFRASGGEYSLLTEDGSLLLATSQRQLSLWDIGTGERLWDVDSPSTVTGVQLSEDESLVYAGGHDGAVRIWDAGTGDLVNEFRGHRLWSWFGSMTADGTRLASFSADRTVRIWDLTPGSVGEITGFNLPGWPVLQSGKVAGSTGAILQYMDVASTWIEPGAAVVFDASSGEIERRFDGYGGQMVRLSHDGTLLAGQPFVAPGVVGSVHIRDVESGEVLVELEDLCAFDIKSEAPGPDCDQNPDARADFLYWIDFSPDGSMIAMSGEHMGIAGVWDVETGRRLLWLNVPTAGPENEPVLLFSPTSDLLLAATSELIVFETDGWSQVATQLPINYTWWDLLFTPDGSKILGADTQVGIVTIDTTTWEYEGEPILGHEGAIRDMDLSDDGTLIATAGSDGFVRIWSVQTRDLHQAIPIGDASIVMVEFISDQHLLVVPQGLPGVVMTIDIPELVEVARSRVTRGFTQTECTAYHLDPCPSLQDIRPRP